MTLKSLCLKPIFVVGLTLNGLNKTNIPASLKLVSWKGFFKKWENGM